MCRFRGGSADVMISDIPIALHCNYGLYFNSTDGVQIDNVRIFQIYNNSINLTDCEFVSGSDIVLFETADISLVIDGTISYNSI